MWFYPGIWSRLGGGVEHSSRLGLPSFALVFFLQVFLVANLPKACLGTSKFQVRIEYIHNRNGELANGQCCGASSADSQCLEQCRTCFYICGDVYRASYQPGSSCIIGESTTSILGNNSFTIPDTEGAVASFDITYAWLATMTSKMAEKVPMRFFQGAHGRIEFIRMKGPEGKGHAEMAVSRFRRLSKDGSYDDHSISSDGSGSNSVTSSPERTRYSSSCTSSPVPQPKNGMKKSSSDSGMLFQLTRESDDLPDNQNNSNFPVKLTRQGSDALQWLKRRTHKEPILNAHLTYVTLPWHRIIADVLEVRLEPVLS